MIGVLEEVLQALQAHGKRKPRRRRPDARCFGLSTELGWGQEEEIQASEKLLRGKLQEEEAV